MARPQTLNNMEGLIDSEFGVPCPRHGLPLLYWFARDFIDFDCDNEMQTMFHPNRGEFGFHHFQNRLDNCSVPLLPEGAYPYYEVGNLHLPASSDLPPYVRKRFNNGLDGSNKDRIIISMRQGLQVDRVYVTQHDDLTSFDPENTFRISKGLLMYIRKVGLGLGDFLREAGYIPASRPIIPVREASRPITQQSSSPAPMRSASTVVNVPSVKDSQGSGGFRYYCTIL